MTSEQRELNKKVLDRIANDPSFRDEILDDPKGALERAGFGWEMTTGDDVSGYGIWPTTAIGCVEPKPGREVNPPGILGGGGGGAVTTALTCTDPAQYPSAFDTKPTKPTPTIGTGGPGDVAPHKPLADS